MVIRNATAQIPVVGPWISRIGRVQRIMATPCSIDPEIWVYAFFHSLPRMVVSLYKPTAFDLVTERYSAGHKKKRKRKFLVEDEFFDRHVKLGKAQWAVFQLGRWAERIGWYMLIVDAGVNLAVDWTSMAYQWSGCRDPSSPWGVCTMGNITTRFVEGGYTALWSPADNNKGITASLDKITCAPGLQATPMLSLSVERPPAPYQPANIVELQVVDLATGWESPPIRYDDFADHPQTERFVYQDWGYIGPRHDYRVRCNSMDGVATFKGKFAVNGYISKGIIGDP